MSRKQVLVQLDDDLVARLDELATAMGSNRSELLRRGAAAILAVAEDQRDDAALAAAYRERPQDPLLIASAARLATETLPQW